MNANRLTCLVIALCLSGCGGGPGGGSPTAPTPTSTPTPTAVAPVSVTLNLRIGPAPTAAAQEVSISTRIHRQVRLLGDITANSGYADVIGNISYPGSFELPFPEALPLPLPPRLERGVPFSIDTVLDLQRPPTSGGFGEGTFTIRVTGTGQDGTAINVQQQLPFLDRDLFVNPAPCTPSDTTLCAFDRFRIQVTGTDSAGQTGPGHVQTGGRRGDGGYFWLLRPDSPDLLVQVRNQCESQNRFWVTVARLSNVDVTVRVTDTRHGVDRTYTSPLNTSLQPFLDTEAFQTCP